MVLFCLYATVVECSDSYMGGRLPFTECPRRESNPRPFDVVLRSDAEGECFERDHYGLP